EMIVSGNYFQVQIDFQPFWEKPPLFIWMQVISMKIFGITAFAARLPNAIIGIFTLCMLYVEGARMRGKQFGRLVAAFFYATVLPFLYFKSGIIDPSFNFFIFLGLMQIIRFEAGNLGESGIKGSPWIAGFWIGIATLTKGPVALLVTLLIYLTYKLIWDRKQFPWLAMFKFTVVFLGVILTWFGSIVLLTEDGLETIRKFIVYQTELFSQPVAGHGQPFFYHPLVFTLGCFPMAAFVYRAMGLRFENGREALLKRFMLVWFWVIMILFSIVRTKIVHYSSLLYYPGAFLAAMYFWELLEGKKRLHWDNYFLYGLGVLIFGVGVAGVNFLAVHPEWIAPLIQDEFGKAALQVNVGWSGWEFVPAGLFMVAMLLNFYFLWQNKYRLWLLIQVIAMPLYINGINALVAPRIADYSQNSAIQFFEEKAGEDAYIMVDGYKSYAHYFYGKIKPFPHPEIPYADKNAWLARGKVDKRVYLVTRIDKATEEFENVWFEKFRRLETRGGFVFYVREPDFAPKSLLDN
ncbi:MAG TPA: hypothetical protein ENJ82_16830, partial [Bacteroidetes bacterium]|nr:hypothetical protein [Bacteroidota bacterium]